MPWGMVTQQRGISTVVLMITVRLALPFIPDFSVLGVFNSIGASQRLSLCDHWTGKIPSLQLSGVSQVSKLAKLQVSLTLAGSVAV